MILKKGLGLRGRKIQPNHRSRICLEEEKNLKIKYKLPFQSLFYIRAHLFNLLTN